MKHVLVTSKEEYYAIIIAVNFKFNFLAENKTLWRRLNGVSLGVQGCHRYFLNETPNNV